jgi:hypothetical protein
MVRSSGGGRPRAMLVRYRLLQPFDEALHLGVPKSSFWRGTGARRGRPHRSRP